MNPSVTAYISSKDRYFSTLPSAILSIIYQTVRPERFILFMDGEHIDLRENDLYLGLFRLLDLHKIKWEAVFGARKGQVANHQMAIEMSQTDWIWRVDDDCFPTPTVLQELLSCDSEKVGAIGGLVLNPDSVQKSPPGLTGSINNLTLNTQWFLHDSPEPFEVEHLYSTFLYKKRAAGHGYCMDLSPAGHREESLMSHQMYRNGWKLIVNPKAITWHVKQSQGGIRAHQTHPEYWDHDENIFQKKLKEWGVEVKERKLVILDNGKGDHVVFKSILPQIKERFKDKEIVIAAAYPDVFADDNGITIISIAEAKSICSQKGLNYDDFNVYWFCSAHNWKKHLSEAFLELYS